MKRSGQHSDSCPSKSNSQKEMHSVYGKHGDDLCGPCPRCGCRRRAWQASARQIGQIWDRNQHVRGGKRRTKEETFALAVTFGSGSGPFVSEHEQK